MIGNLQGTSGAVEAAATIKVSSSTSSMHIGIEEFARVKGRREGDKKARDGREYVSQPQKKIPWNSRLFSSGKLDRLRSTSRMDYSHATYSSWLLLISSFVYYSRFTYSLAKQRQEIEKVGFLVPIPSARRFLLIIPVAGGYCVAPLIGAKGLDEQKPGFI
ncbi:hypothetical protein NC651_008298 [Populus alba x Populus x berolinensis]|nr:hypothetical protein NC651_008298 [Populus alba x Populus x berolinensis]